MVLDQSILDDGTISQKTIKNYKSNINELNIHLKKKNIEIDDIDNMMVLIKKISKNNKNKMGNFVSAIMKILQLQKNDELRNKYKTELTETFKELNKPKQKTEKQDFVSEHYVNDVKAFIKHLEDNIKNLSEIETLLSFYIIFPPRRRDYLQMFYTTDLENTKDETKNWIYRKDGKSRVIRLILNNFKNVKNIGKQEFRLNPKGEYELLRKIIMKRKFNEGDKLYNKSVKTFEREMKEITKKWFGRPLTIIDLRVLHSTSNFHNLNVKQLLDDAEKMAHNPMTKMISYIRK